MDPQRHCSFVLLAEFDIDRGSTLAHVWPDKAVVEGHDDHTLAELMLPDGAHARSEDWTVFLLKDKVPTTDSEDRDEPVTYVLNLVRTKHDDSVRRGALVKAMAIGTRHPCIHVFKPTLLLALDEYFSSPGTTTALEHLYNCINSLDVTPAPVFTHSEKLVLRASERKDLFLDRFSSLSRPGSTDSHYNAQQPHTPKDTHFWETSVHYGKMDIPVRWPLDAFDDEVGEYSLTSLFTTFSSQPVTGPLHGHLHSNGPHTPPMTILFNAILTYKRVIFLGHNLPAATVAGHVLAAAALASGCGAVIPDVTRRRCSPYANLISLDELEQTPGYIAGVTNPRFEDLKCWDVLCNIETGKITIAKDIEPAPRLAPSMLSASNNAPSYSTGGIGSTIGSMGISNDLDSSISASSTSSMAGISRTNTMGPGSSLAPTTTSEFGTLASTPTTHLPPSGIPEARPDSFDALFMEEIQSAITSRYSESYIRCRIIDYVTSFTRHITRHEDHFYSTPSPSLHRFLHQPYLNGQLGSGTAFGDRENEMREIVSNAGRVEGFRSTTSYGRWCRVDAERRAAQRKVFAAGEESEGSDLWHQISRLRGRGRQVSTQEVELIFALLDRCVRSHEQVVELLTLLPSYAGGLSPLAHGLYHPSPSVRLSACDLLTRLGTHTSVGLKLLQSMPLFHRLAMARVQHQWIEDMQRLQGGAATPATGGGGGGRATTPAPMSRSKSPAPSSPLNIATLKRQQAEQAQAHQAHTHSHSHLPPAASTFLAAPGGGGSTPMSRQASGASASAGEGLPPTSTSTFRELQAGGGGS